MKWLDRLLSYRADHRDDAGVFAPPLQHTEAILVSHAYLCVECRVILKSPKGYHCPRCGERVRALPYILRGLWRALEKEEPTSKRPRTGTPGPLNTTLCLTSLKEPSL